VVNDDGRRRDAAQHLNRTQFGQTAPRPERNLFNFK
jgi:hypothetical protein